MNINIETLELLSTETLVKYRNVLLKIHEEVESSGQTSNHDLESTLVLMEITLRKSK